jgi:hypothetical protein
MLEHDMNSSGLQRKLEAAVSRDCLLLAVDAIKKGCNCKAMARK